MLSKSMFIVGFIIFSIYLIGLFYMINWGDKSQEEEEASDKELKKQFSTPILALYLEKFIAPNRRFRSFDDGLYETLLNY